LGCLNSAADDFDPHDLAEVPPVGESLNLYFAHPEWNLPDGRFTSDFRTIQEKGHIWEFCVQAPRNVQNFQIKLEKVINLPDNWKIILTNKQQSGLNDLLNQKPIEYRTDLQHSSLQFQLYIGPAVHLENEVDKMTKVPEKFNLAQNFPNPLNAMTIIEFDLPEAALVDVTIYNALGEPVRKLFRQTSFMAGHFKISWNDTDDIGETLPSGIYFYALKANQDFEMRKMIFLR